MLCINKRLYGRHRGNRPHWPCRRRVRRDGTDRPHRPHRAHRRRRAHRRDRRNRAGRRTRRFHRGNRPHRAHRRNGCHGRHGPCRQHRHAGCDRRRRSDRRNRCNGRHGPCRQHRHAGCDRRRRSDRRNRRNRRNGCHRRNRPRLGWISGHKRRHARLRHCGGSRHHAEQPARFAARGRPHFPLTGAALTHTKHRPAAFRRKAVSGFAEAPRGVSFFQMLLHASVPDLRQYTHFS